MIRHVIVLLIFIGFLGACASSNESSEESDQSRSSSGPVSIEQALDSLAGRIGQQNHVFLIDVVKDDSVLLFQILHSSLNLTTKRNAHAFGVCIQLTFDTATALGLNSLEKFKNSPISSQFLGFNYIDNPTYVRSFATQMDSVLDVSRRLSESIFQCSDCLDELYLHDAGYVKDLLN